MVVVVVVVCVRVRVRVRARVCVCKRESAREGESERELHLCTPITSFPMTLSGGNSVKRYTIFGCGILWPKSVTKRKNPGSFAALQLVSTDFGRCGCQDFFPKR